MECLRACVGWMCMFLSVVVTVTHMVCIAVAKAWSTMSLTCIRFCGRLLYSNVWCALPIVWCIHLQIELNCKFLLPHMPDHKYHLFIGYIWLISLTFVFLHRKLTSMNLNPTDPPSQEQHTYICCSMWLRVVAKKPPMLSEATTYCSHMVEGLAAWPSKGGEMTGGVPYSHLEVIG